MSIKITCSDSLWIYSIDIEGIEVQFDNPFIYFADSKVTSTPTKGKKLGGYRSLKPSDCELGACAAVSQTKARRCLMEAFNMSAQLDGK